VSTAANSLGGSHEVPDWVVDGLSPSEIGGLGIGLGLALTALILLLVLFLRYLRQGCGRTMQTFREMAGDSEEDEVGEMDVVLELQGAPWRGDEMFPELGPAN
jgi:hypothetical protein